MRVTVSLVWSYLILAVPGSLLAQQTDNSLVDAVRYGGFEVVQARLKQSVDVNERQPDGATALHWAVYLDDLDASRLLLEAGAAADVHNELGVTPLYLACENGNARLVRLLLLAGANPQVALPSGETALMTASRAGSVDAVKALLDHGADVNARELTAGQSALMWAVSQQHSDVVGILIDSGAKINLRSHVRSVPTSRSTSAGRAGAVAVIQEGGFTPLLFAARQGDLASAQYLLDAGADVNDTAPAGTSALVVAAHSGHGRLGALLLDYGADPNAAGAGYTALHAAVLRGDSPLVGKLLSHGANPNMTLASGTRHARQGKLWALDTAWIGATPYFLAAKFGSADIMRQLVHHGADSQAGLGDVTPLMVAAGMLTRGFGRAGTDRRGREMDSAEMEFALRQDPDQRSLMKSGIDAVVAAVEFGADVNATDENGETALHLAAFHGFRSVVHFLVREGADLAAKNDRGETPLGRAMRARAPARLSRSLVDYTDTTMADLLRELGASE
ncbi:MAG: hypothetical protein CL484_06760 [Acidobacteria bacterium]|nr:hypothetical protein [Acidobacteriota bacterium]|tara:strand:- start:277 stop:1791 length:1515 start_codon:yes stop_codon:yes gene_type:complete